MSSEQVEEVPKLSNCPPVKPKCPNCNNNENVIRIIYGYPSPGWHTWLLYWIIIINYNKDVIHFFRLVGGS